LSREDTNELWARRLAAGCLPGELFRWELYDRTLAGLLEDTTLWLDLGCGETDFITEHRGSAYGAGIDSCAPRKACAPFVRADLAALPVRSGSVGLVCLRFVIEHLSAPEKVWAECRRVLASRGRILIITTNRLSPQVALGRILPESIKKLLIVRLFGVDRESILPAFHLWNTPGRLRCPPPGFELERIEFVEALNWHSRALFLILLALAVLTRPRALRPLRSNILAVYRRVEDKNE